MRRRVFALVSSILLCSLGLFAQGPISLGRHARPLIHQNIDESRRVTLAGNIRPEVSAALDRGPVAANFALDHMLLQLHRSADQEHAVRRFIDDLHNPQSPDFHRWLTAAQFGERFGAARQDVDTVTLWLRSHGFKVNSVSSGGLTIDFSGTAAQVRNAFRADIHALRINGASHIANVSDPQIPQALVPVVAGIASLHDFKPRSLARPHTNFTFTNQNSPEHAVVPGDLSTIYNMAPAFAAGFTGKGQTIAVIEDTDLYDPNDWTVFRAAFGLAQYGGWLTTLYPGNCEVPGVNSDDAEAILDAEWAGAAAPDANIVVAACANTPVTFGGAIALNNLVNSAFPPQIISLSYGECEAENGAAGNAFFSSLYQQAVAEGVSIFVASGDQGAASCDAGFTSATHGIGVSAFASTPYNVAVGGTDFADSYNHNTANYWNPANSARFDSAISYIPEMPWNDSCGSDLLASFFNFATPYGSAGLCASSIAKKYSLQQVVAASGGPSGCATGSPGSFGLVGGSCQGYAKPSWQSGVAGIPADGVRDLPDVSLFAADGLWGHYYVICWSDTLGGGYPCSGDPSTWAGAGGTSFGAPIMAGIQALINQSAGGAQGNPNYVYYRLASNSASVCDSSAGDSPSSPCIFHNVTQGDIAVNCSGGANCYGAPMNYGRRSPLGGIGALSIDNSNYAPAFGAAAGWNFATGIGSVNVFNLITNWKTAQ